MNRQRLRRARDLLGALRVTVFSPDDLALVKGARRGAGSSSTTCWWRSTPGPTAVWAEVERTLRQRNALLQAVPAAASTRRRR